MEIETSYYDRVKPGERRRPGRAASVLHSEQMSKQLRSGTRGFAEWLNDAARRTGVPKGRIVREELEKARISQKRPSFAWLVRLQDRQDLSTRKGFSRK